MSKRQKENILLFIVNIFFVIVCFLVLVPVLYALSVSLNADNSLLSADFSFLPKHLTLANYHAVFFKEPILLWLKNSLILAVVTLIISLGTGIPAAYVFSRKRFPGRKAILKVLILLYAFPSLLSMTALYKLLTAMGLVNTKTGLIIVYTGTMAVFALWNMKGYFDTIPTEIEEAAMIDGANRFQRIKSVTLPSIAPTISIMLIMQIGRLMSLGYEKIILLYNGSTYETADVISTYVYRRGILSADFSYSTAVGLFQSVIGVILLVASNQISKKLSDSSLW